MVIALEARSRENRDIGAISEGFLRPAAQSRTAIAAHAPVIPATIVPSQHAAIASDVFRQTKGDFEVPLVSADLQRLGAIGQLKRMLVEAVLRLKAVRMLQRTQLEREGSQVVGRQHHIHGDGLTWFISRSNSIVLSEG